MLTALSDNPARFRLLAGQYTVGVNVGGELKGQTALDLVAGQDQTIQINLGSP